MPPTLQELGIDQLSADDRLALAEAIWDSLTQEVEQAPLSEAQHQDLERRLKAYRANPTAGLSWEEVKARLLGPS
ncbi:MAG: addiction module protein [Gemmataceae bacterium]|nr:addiction module protein [Gemmataceae bacterium]